jgi:hypothetical protein
MIPVLITILKVMGLIILILMAAGAILFLASILLVAVKGLKELKK